MSDIKMVWIRTLHISIFWRIRLIFRLTIAEYAGEVVPETDFFENSELCVSVKTSEALWGVSHSIQSRVHQFTSLSRRDAATGAKNPHLVCDNLECCPPLLRFSAKHS